jgi:hypothetical protein
MSLKVREEKEEEDWWWWWFEKTREIVIARVSRARRSFMIYYVHFSFFFKNPKLQIIAPIISWIIIIICFLKYFLFKIY